MYHLCVVNTEGLFDFCLFCFCFSLKNWCSEMTSGVFLAVSRLE